MPAFSPQPLTRADIDAYRQRALEEARNALGMLASSLEQVPAGDRDRAGRRAGAARSGVGAHRRHVRRRRRSGVKFRIHGDYHLGQVLVTRNDFVIIDFEGEPGHSLEQRARQAFAAAGRRRHAALLQLRAAQRPAQRRSQRGGSREAGAAGAGVGDRGARGIPRGLRCGGARREALRTRGAAGGPGLLGLFELEKALYELRYELGNRPGWAGIPLQGILDWDANK